MSTGTDETDEQYEGWAIVEIMGRRRIIGYLTRQVMFGRDFMRVDLPAEPPATQFYGADAVYCITPTTEDMARRAAGLNRVAPVSRWELPAPVILQRKEAGDDDDEVDAEITGDGEPDVWTEHGQGWSDPADCKDPF